MAKIGQNALSNAIVRGAKEVAQVLPAFPGQSVGIIEEPGLGGSLAEAMDGLASWAEEAVKGKEADQGIGM